MNIKYFQDTDTLYIEFKPAEVAESKDLDENTVLDLDQNWVQETSLLDMKGMNLLSCLKT